MKQTRFIIAAWLLLLVPTLLIGGWALKLLRFEQQRIAGAAVAAATERARSVAESIELSVAEVKDSLEQSLWLLPGTDLERRLEAWQDSNPLIRNVFVWTSGAGLRFPPPRAPGNSEEESFVTRFGALFQGRAAWLPAPAETAAAPAPASASVYSARRELRELAQQKATVAAESDVAAAPAAGAAITSGEAGWTPWFWENQLHLLGWVEPAGAGLRYGVEVEMMVLLGRLVANLPQSPPPGEVYALLDDAGRIFHQTGSEPLAPAAAPALAIPVGAALPHWQVAVFAPGGGLTETGDGGLQLLSTLLVGAFIVAILFGGSLLLWQAQRNLLDARRKTSFVSNVSHELKTPLTTIRMYAELLGEGTLISPEKRGRYLEVITSESQRLTRLVNNVLDFSRLEQGRKTYAPESVELGPALHDLLDAQLVRVEAAGMRLVRRIADEPLRVQIDRDALEQALLNLIDNALKYGEAGKLLEVELAVEGSLCCLRIMDRGPGVPAAHRRRIFDKFHRVDDSLTARRQGSGLGLTIARQLLRDQGGDLVYAPRQGGGSCFEITLPRAEGGKP